MKHSAAFAIPFVIAALTSSARANDADEDHAETYLNSGPIFDHSLRGQGNGYGLEVSFMHFPNGAERIGYGAFTQAQVTSRGAGRFAGGFQFGKVIGAEFGLFDQTGTDSEPRRYGMHTGLFLMMYALVALRLDVPFSRESDGSFQSADVALTLGFKIPWNLTYGGIGPKLSGIPMR
ncbi:MAG TPA: hypothetical protein VIV60_01035 [Polyangiaceae bacterium]